MKKTEDILERLKGQMPQVPDGDLLTENIMQAITGAAAAKPGRIVPLWLNVLRVVSSVAAFIFQNWGNNYVTVSEATLFANLTTVISIFAGVIFLHEIFTVQQIIGALAILISVFVAIVELGGRKRRKDL